MKFTKFGKALLMSALSAAVILSITSCVQSYTTGFLYVTGLVTSGTGGEGIISGFKIDHNTGKLSPVDGLPISSGGANPVRAVMASSSRFLYVLNRGTNAQGNGDCTTATPCQNSNITEFAAGGNGILTFQETFYTQGINPFRLLIDPANNFLYVLEHDAPSSAACAAALGGSVSSCGDITVFQINSTTGRLSTLSNSQITTANCPSSQLTCPLTYFPVPANPVDFAFSNPYILTVSANSAQTSFPYTGGSTVYPYSYTSGTGQLSISQNGSQAMGVSQGNAIVVTGGVAYILDNEATLVSVTGAQSQILPFQQNSGTLNIEASGVVADDPTLANPTQVLIESKGKFLYVANQGNLTQGNNPTSGLTGYVINNPFQLTFIPGEPFGSGSGPQCIVEDPSDQFIYTANFNDSSVTGRVVDPNSGVLNPLRVPATYSLQGPATWCLVDGRTS